MIAGSNVMVVGCTQEYLKHNNIELLSCNTKNAKLIYNIVKDFLHNQYNGYGTSDGCSSKHSEYYVVVFLFLTFLCDSFPTKFPTER